MNPNFKFIRLMLLLPLMLASCAYAPWQKDGVAGATPEQRMSNAIEAQKKKPDDTKSRKDLRVTSEQTPIDLLTEADRQLRQGLNADAQATYERVLKLDPYNQRALAGVAAIKRDQAHETQVAEARELLAKGGFDVARENIHRVLLEEPTHAGALELQAEIQRKQSATVRSAPPALKPPFAKPVTLELRDASIKMVFEALSRATGINFILDKDIKPDAKATVFIKKAPIEEAIEMVLATNGLQKKVLSETNALIFPNTAQKQKDYQDLMIRSFYLTNTTAKQVGALLKTMLKIKDIHIDDRLNMIMVRDRPEVIHLAEKLVAANDMADPEVMLEMEVLEVSRSRLQELGVQYPNQISINSRIPVTTALAGVGGAVTTTTATTTTALTLEGLKNLTSSRFDVSPNPAANFKKTTGDVNLLANPRIRVRNNEKAKVQVGDKVPVITTTATAGVGSSETVQYVDVGLKLEVEPRIALDNYVNIKVGLEVSSLGEKTKLTNGSTVYQIGTRNANTTLRLRDGETQVLAGLISDDERNSANKLPGLGDIPLLGRLFSSQSDSKNKTEIVLAITPRVLSNINRPEADVSEYWSGTESVISDHAQIVVPANGGDAGGNARNLLQRPVIEPVEPVQEVPAQPEVAPSVENVPNEQPLKSITTPVAPPASL